MCIHVQTQRQRQRERERDTEKSHIKVCPVGLYILERIRKNAQGEGDAVYAGVYAVYLITIFILMYLYIYIYICMLTPPR